MTESAQLTGWRRFVPISVWLATYETGFLVPDIIAALTVWALMVPEAMAYASIAGMPPETGLYAALVAPLAYAIFGTSRQLNVGPSSTVAVLSSSLARGSFPRGRRRVRIRDPGLALILHVEDRLEGVASTDEEPGQNGAEDADDAAQHEGHDDAVEVGHRVGRHP